MFLETAQKTLTFGESPRNAKRLCVVSLKSKSLHSDGVHFHLGEIVALSEKTMRETNVLSFFCFSAIKLQKSIRSYLLSTCIQYVFNVKRRKKGLAFGLHDVYITVDFAEHARCFRQNYEVDHLSVHVFTTNRFFFCNI